ncbi:ABC transporter permease [Pseudoalteromonas luteoviolacea]|uniref:ABC transporter permease n=1 Tax=Pseudoalteromonas luteoviolacea TaxID=43657 RepID=UPI001151BC99|nr:FtsX-like permease family protein [Pseudoalteromonas luteoviolacea]TQF67673.1 FtsX-like permease family protein [Pseudoalteromonas luteoviolacea]
MIDTHTSSQSSKMNSDLGSVSASLMLVKIFFLQVKKGKHLIPLLSLALLFLYLSLTSLLGQGVDKYLNHNLQTMLGADTQISINRDWHSTEVEWISTYADALSYFESYEVTLGGDAYSHTKLKAVDSTYPLNGEITIATNQQLTPKLVSHGPQVGEIWLEPHLARALKVDVGDSVTLGASQLLVSALLLNEPDRIIQGYSSDRRAMVSKQSLSSLEITPEKRQVLINHNGQTTVEHLKQLQKNSADIGVVSKLLNNYPMAHAWQRVQNFMGLISFVIVLLTCLCLWLSQRSHVEPIQSVIAVMLANGVKQTQIPLLVMSLILSILAVSFIPAIAIALVLATFVEQFVQQNMFETFELMWDMTGIGQALLMSVILYALLTIPSWVKLLKSTVRDLLEKRENNTVTFIVSGVCPVLSLLVVVFINTDNWTLTGILLAGLAVCLILLLALTWGMLSIAHRFLDGKGGVLAFVLLLMKQRMNVKIVQIVALGLSATLLLLCLRVGQDVNSALERALFEDQGNIFVTQANNTQKQAIEAFAVKHGGEAKQFKAFQSARVTHVNDITISQLDAPPSDSRTRLERNINLHWKLDQPKNIKVVEGQWQYEQRAIPAISMEQEVFEELNLSLGDVLTMQVGSQSRDFQIASVHHYRSGEDSITFWFVVHQAEVPVTSEQVYYMGSVDLPKQGLDNLGDIWQAYPSIRMLRVEELLSRVRSTIETFMYLTFAYGVFIALMSNLLVIASIQTHLQRDKLKNGLLLSFGLTEKQGRNMLIAEWAILTIVPVACAMTSVYLFIGQIYQQGFGFVYRPNEFMLLVESVAIVLAVAIGGVCLSLKQLKQSVTNLLEQRG